MDDNNQLVVFSYASPFHESVKLPERLFTICNQHLRISQKYKSDGRGGTELGFGASVYDCSFIVAHFFEKHANEIVGKTGIELGCGPGLASIGASLAGARYVIATDGDEDSVALAQLNIASNASNHRIHSQRLLWGEGLDIRDALDNLNMKQMQGKGDSGSRFDFIIATDVAALPYEESYRSLIDTMHALSKPETVVYFCYQKRHKSEDAFFNLLQEKFTISRCDPSDIHADFSDRPIYLCKLFPKKLLSKHRFDVYPSQVPGQSRTSTSTST